MAERFFLGCWMALAALVAPAFANEALPVAKDPVLEARVMAIATELRCLVCQNETIAHSHADLAVDLRNQIRDQLSKGQTESQIRDYMTARYGDFVLYKPPFKPTTALLWVGPPLLLLVALLGLFMTLRARQRAQPDAFDPDTPDDDPNAGPAR
jgi:cytochrome c-type biogenesis protein CcmH